MRSFAPPKSVIALVALATTNGSTSVSEPIDCVGYSYLSLDVYGSPIAAASNRPTGLKLAVDCRARKRWLKLSVSPRTTQDFFAIANLMHGEIAPFDAERAN